MVVAVTDLNDVPPMFTRTPRGNVIDVRNDGVGSSNCATKYFAVDEETGPLGTSA